MLTWPLDVLWADAAINQGNFVSVSYKYLPLFILFILSGCDNQFTDIIGDNWIQKDEVCAVDNTPVSFKKVAYWTPDDSDNLELVKFSSLTHIIYSSISVNADGSLVVPDDTALLEDLVDYAQSAGIKVAVSLGDGSDNNFNSIADSSTLTNAFTKSVANFIDDYELDGVDLNWQTINDKNESNNLEYLLKKLSEKLTGQSFLSMTAPSGEDGAQADNINNDMFVYVDFVNVMAFDSTDKDNLHSSMQDATEAVSYWSERCLIKNKIVLGVPFYSAGKALRSYDYLIRDDISYACVDESEGRDYNGIPTIIDKTNYAMLYAGGIMMKSLQQDWYRRNSDENDDPFVIDDYSLLNTINETALGNVVSLCE